MTRAPSISLQCQVARTLVCSAGFSRRLPVHRLKPMLQTKVRATGRLRTAFLLLFAMLANAAPLDLSAWKYRKRIPLTSGDGLAVVKLDREVYAANGSRYYKMRVFRDSEEVPFIFGTAGRALDDRTAV